ncbi:hypothetical protein D3C78_1518230 [compost metagenome]
MARITVRPDGSSFPCVMKSTNKSQNIGNVLEDSPDIIYENQVRYFNCEKNYCSGSTECCNVNGRKNVIVEKALKLDYLPDTSNVRWSSFF